MKSNKSLEEKYLDFLNDLITKIDLSIMLEDTKYVSTLKKEIKQLIKDTYYQSKINKLKQSEINKVKLYLFVINSSSIFLKDNFVLHTILKKDEDITEAIYHLFKSLHIYKKLFDEFKKDIKINLFDILNRASSLNLYYYIDDVNNMLDVSNLNEVDLNKLTSKELEITSKEFNKLNIKKLLNI